MNIAICFTGQCRSLEYTYDSINSKILQPLKKYADRVDIFAYVAENRNSYKFKKYFKEYADLKIEPDKQIDTSFIIRHDQRGMQGYMQMLNGYYQVNKMRQEYQKEKGLKYDAVIRARLDVEFVDDIPDIRNLDLQKMYIPDFHSWSHVTAIGGCNDRFAIANEENINHYYDQKLFLHEFINAGHSLHAESFLYYNLLKNKVSIEKFDFKFARIREGKVYDESDLTICNKPRSEWEWWQS